MKIICLCHVLSYQHTDHNLRLVADIKKQVSLSFSWLCHNSAVKSQASHCGALDLILDKYMWDLCINRMAMEQVFL